MTAINYTNNTGIRISIRLEWLAGLHHTHDIAFPRSGFSGLILIISHQDQNIAAGALNAPEYDWGN